MNTELLIGVDPGLSGGVAIISLATRELLSGWTFTSSDGMLNVPDLLTRLDELHPLKVRQVVVEQVGSMPRQGVSSTFTFGRAYGTVEGVIQSYRWPIAHITPAQWKRKLGMPKDDKDGPRQWAQRQWPNAADLLATKVRGQAIADAAALATAWWELHR